MKVEQFIAAVIFVMLFSSKLQGQYFQQDVDYQIEASLDTVAHELTASMSLHYVNNAPHDLDTIYFHLWANAFKTNQTAFAKQMLQLRNTAFHFANEAERGGYKSISLMYDGAPISFSYVDRHQEIAYLVLPKSLSSGQSCEIAIDYVLDIPTCFVRHGHRDGMYHMVAWYPKPAVYDMMGWHTFPYLAYGEFYSEYGDYEVQIKVPKGLQVMSSGTLSNETTSDSQDVYTYKIVNAHDFAWFANQFGHIEHKKLKLQNGQTIEVELGYNEHQEVWQTTMDKVERILNFMTAYVGAYPYPSLKIVQDVDQVFGSAMEYPSIKLLQNIADEKKLDYYLAHEIAHAWWYGAIGSNEREESYFDEGLATFLEQEYTYEFYEKNYYDAIIPFGRSSQDKPTMRHVAEAQIVRCRHQSLNSDVAELSALNYGLNAYQIGSTLIYYIKSLVGEYQLRNTLSGFYEKWKYKHPRYEDFLQYAEKQNSINLDGIRDIIAGKCVDVAVEKSDSEWRIVQKSDADIAVPISIIHKDGSKTKRIISPTPSGAIIEGSDVAQVLVDEDHTTLDVNRNNNQWPRPSIGIKMFPNWDEQSQREIYLGLALGLSRADGIRLGLIGTNSSLPSKKFRISLSPQYAFNSKKLVGSIHMQYAVPKWQNGYWKYKLDASSYGLEEYNTGNVSRYYRIAPAIAYEHYTHPKSNQRRESKLTQLLVSREYPILESATIDQYITRLDHTRSNNDILYPSSSMIRLEYNSYKNLLSQKQSYLKLSAELNQSYAYAPRKALHFRLFGAGFLHNSRRESSSYNNALTLGSISLIRQGFNDYALDESFYSRQGGSTLLDRQVSQTGGGFKDAIDRQYSRIGQSNNWAFAINSSADLPFPWPSWSHLMVFFDLGYASTKSVELDPLKSELFYSGGFMIKLPLVSIHFPVIASDQINDTYRFEDRGFLNKISFAIQLDHNLWDKLDWYNF